MMFLNLLAFVLRAQWKQLFQFRNTLSVVGRGLYLSVVLLYAVGFGYILQNAVQFRLSTELLLNGLNTAIIVLTFAKSYFPAYLTTSQPIASFYPLSRSQKALLGLLTDMLSVFPLAMLTFYAVAFGMAFSSLTLFQMLSSLLTFVAALVLDRSLRLIIEYAVRLRWLYGACALATAAVLVGQTLVLKFVQIPSAVFGSALFAAACVMQALLAWQSVLPSTETAGTLASFRTNTDISTTSARYAFRAFFGSKHIIILFGMALLLKTGFMIFTYKANAEDIAQISSRLHLDIIWVYAAPIAWFTYFLNNSFGLNWQLWQTVQQHSVRQRTVLVLYARHAFLPLCVDAMLTSTVLWSRNLLTMNIIAFWVWCMIAFWAVSIATSIFSPIKVEKLTSNVFMSLRQVSPTVGMVGVIILFITLFFLASLHYLLGGIIALIAIAAVAYIIINYNTLKYRTYNGIHQ